MKNRLKILLIFGLVLLGFSVQSQTDCLDFTDLNDNKVRLVSGYYSAEIECTAADTDWFQVMNDVDGYDWRTDNTVKIIPQGEEHSVRIGRITKYDTYITKQIGYNFVIDTSIVDTLMFCYAIVGDLMSQNFHVDVIDETTGGNRIYGDYGEFIGANDKWTYSQNKFWYRDWDTLYIDLSQYHGDSVRFRSMINVGATEIAYYYFTVKCLKQTYQPEPADTIDPHICTDVLPYIYDGVQYDTMGVYLVEKEDTSYYLSVGLNYNDTITAFGCDTGYYDDGFFVQTSGVYTQNLQSQYGCDSIVTLDFTRFDVFRDTVKYQIYKGQTYTDSNFSETESGTYEKVFIDTNGCDSVYVLELDVLQFKFPNVVTPNGDGINDLFEIYGLLDQTMFNDITLIIYNRYGRQIFKQTQFKSKEDFWNPASTNTSTGTYFYRFIARSKQKNIDLTGVIEVLL